LEGEEGGGKGEKVIEKERVGERGGEEKERGERGIGYCPPGDTNTQLIVAHEICFFRLVIT
jgi:hypothetical protein